MNHILVAINAKFSHTNLAVRYLRHSLLEQDLSCEIAEYTINQPVRFITADLARRKPASLLFSCYLWNIEMVCKIAGDLRALFPKARILLGGPEVSYETSFQRFPFADGILCGEGEASVAVALQETQQKIYRSSGYVNMDSLPFPYDDLSQMKNRVLYYESSRGCPFGCNYCLSSADRQVRQRSLPIVLQDLQRFLDAKVMRVKFVDRTFNLDAERAFAIWEYLIQQDNGITGFQMELGGDLLTPKQIQLLAKARPGLFQFEIGVQSTYGPALEAACRRTDFQRLAENVQAVRHAGNIHCHLDLIAGLPKESFPQFLHSFDDVFALRPEQLQLGFLKLLRGSALWDSRETYGLCHSIYPPYEVLETPEISFAELAQLKQLEEVVEIYYNSGRFAKSLSFLLRRFPSPARFFLDLAHSIPDQAVGKYAYYDILFAFAEKSAEPELEKLKWLIRADLCLNERPRRLPECCPQGIKPSKEAVSGFPKGLYFELFPFDFSHHDKNPGNQPVLAAFDYEHRTLLGTATVKIVPYEKELTGFDKVLIMK